MVGRGLSKDCFGSEHKHGRVCHRDCIDYNAATIVSSEVEEGGDDYVPVYCDEFKVGTGEENSK